MPFEYKTPRQSFLAGLNAGGPAEFIGICSVLAENSQLPLACHAAMGYGKRLAKLRAGGGLPPEALFSQAIQIASTEYVSKDLFACACNALRSLVGHAAQIEGLSAADARAAVIADWRPFFKAFRDSPDEFCSLQLDSLSRCLQSKETLQRLFPGHCGCVFDFDEIPALALKAELDEGLAQAEPNKSGRRV